MSLLFKGHLVALGVAGSGFLWWRRRGCGLVAANSRNRRVLFARRVGRSVFESITKPFFLPAFVSIT